jgi:hypothetical protein
LLLLALRSFLAFGGWRIADTHRDNSLGGSLPLRLNVQVEWTFQ